MPRKACFNKFCLFVVFSLVSVIFCSNAFARGTERGRNHEREYVRSGHNRYSYHDGRFYRPSLFGLEFSVRIPPFGVVVSSLPFGYRTIIVENTPYYYYDEVYYKHCPSGYIVVPQPVLGSSVNYNTLAQASNGQTVTINIPSLNGGSIAVTLVKFTNGFVGPKGEFYPKLPSLEQLRARYG